MAFPTWIAPFADGWYPKISPDGRYLLCGAAHASVVDLTTHQIRMLSGAPQIISNGWLNPTQATVSADPTGTDKQWHLQRVDAPTFATLVEIGPSMNFNGAGANVWAGGNGTTIWTGDATGHEAVLYPQPGDPVPGYAATVDAHDGSVAGSVTVHTHPLLKVWKAGVLQRTIEPAYPPNRHLIGAGGYVGYGYYGPSWLNTPDNQNVQVNVTPDNQESPPLPFLHQNQVWLATTSDRGAYLRPLGVRDRAITIPLPAVEVSVVSLGDHFVVALQDDKGRLSVSQVPADTPLQPVAGPPVPPVVVIGRPAYCGWFTFNVPHPVLPGNCELFIDNAHPGDRFLTLPDGTRRAVYAAGANESDLGQLNAAIAAVKHYHLPVLAYWPRSLWPGPLPTGADWLGVEAYQHAGESEAAFTQQVHTQLGRHPHPCLLGQCYTSNTTLTSDLTHLPGLYSQWLKGTPSLKGIVTFSGPTRATGYQDHPEVHQAWTQLAAGIPSVPAADPTPPDPKPPEPPMPQTRTVGLLTWISKFITNENGGDDVGLVIANDRTDAAGVVQPQVVYAWQEMTLVPRGHGKVTINGVSGRFWAAENANTAKAMDPAYPITCKRPEANLNPDSWELFDLLDNGDGTASFKSQFGFYVCCEADGRIVCNRTAIGPYEKFVLLPPGSGVPQPPKPVEPGDPIPMVYAHPNTHFFQLGDGTPWRMKGVTGFKLAEIWRRGGDWRGFLNAYPGYNTVWTFDYTEGPNWVDEPWESLPVDQCVRFVQDVGNVGWRVAHCLLSSSNPARRQHALDLIAAFKSAALTNLFLRGANEPEVQHDGIYIETEFMHQALEQSGYPYCNGVYKQTDRHYGTWLETHTQRDGEWPRRSHDAMDIYHPPADAPPGNQLPHQMPIVLGEPAKYQDVGASVQDWKAYFGSGSFFGAGVVFHSQTGKFADLPTDQEKQLASAALMGLNAFPADAPAGAYSRIDDQTLRTYIVGTASVRIRPTTPTHPQAGWTSLDTDHILYTR
jgi:hypothetical protein